MNLIRDWFQRHFSNPQVMILAILLIAGVLVIMTLGQILAPVLAGLVIAYMLEGLVGILERRGLPRMGAVLIVFLTFLTFLIILLFGLLPKLSVQVGQAASDLPKMISRFQKQLMLLPQEYPEFISPDQVRELMKVFQNGIGRLGEVILSYSIASVRGLITFTVYMILVPLMVFFFLKDKAKILDWISHYMPENRSLSGQVWQEVDAQIGNYMRGKFWEILIIWASSWLVFYFLNLKFAMLIGLLVGLSVIVPYVGVTVTTIPVALVGIFQWGWHPELIYLMIAYGVIQLIDGNLLAPLLLSGVVHMHPVAIITAVMVFGGIWGFWGVFFAIPLATLVHAVLRVWPPNSPSPEAGEKEPG